MLQLAPAADRQKPNETSHALTKLAKCFESQWHDVHGCQPSDASAQIVGHALVLTLTGALTPREKMDAATEAGRLAVIQGVARDLDRMYPQLASEIERVLHCYVGALDVDVTAVAAAVILQLQLRDAPGLMRG